MLTRLSSNARWILAGLSIALVLLLYPPFWHGSHGGQRRWHFVLEKRGQRAHVDVSMLLLEFLVVGIGVTAAWYVSTSLRDHEK
jgi:hypothetical protein